MDTLRPLCPQCEKSDKVYLKLVEPRDEAERKGQSLFVWRCTRCKSDFKRKTEPNQPPQGGGASI